MRLVVQLLELVGLVWTVVLAIGWWRARQLLRKLARDCSERHRGDQRDR